MLGGLQKRKRALDCAPRFVGVLPGNIDGRGDQMRTITAIAAKRLGKFLAKDFREIFGSAQDDRAGRLSSLARSTMECLGRTDALYHNLEHTLLVTLVGRDILRGRTLSERIEATDYDHLIVACLLHDIGYVRGILKGDTKTDFIIDETGKTVTLPRGASDAALTPYHVTRSKIFVYERLGKSPTLDADRLARSIEATRFPPGQADDLEPMLVEQHGLVDQLGDPLYARKANALF